MEKILTELVLPEPLKKKQNFDNVNVVVRCRPQNKREKRGKESVIVQCNTQSSSQEKNSVA